MGQTLDLGVLFEGAHGIIKKDEINKNVARSSVVNMIRNIVLINNVQDWGWTKQEKASKWENIL